MFFFDNLVTNGVGGSRFAQSCGSCSGDPSAVEPPVPISNTEVKRCSPDGSASLGCARVGRCQNPPSSWFAMRRVFLCPDFNFCSSVSLCATDQPQNLLLRHLCFLGQQTTPQFANWQKSPVCKADAVPVHADKPRGYAILHAGPFLSMREIWAVGCAYASCALS